MSQEDQKFVVVIPEVRVWGGEKTMRVDGITAELPDELFRETLKLIPKEFKAPFETKRKASRRVLEKRGIQFAGGVGFVIAAEDMPVVEAELEVLKTEFFDLLEGTFLPQVSTKMIEHAANFPSWETRILSHSPDLQKIRSAFEFKWLITEIGGSHASVISEVNMFERQLYRESADAAREILTRMRERGGSCNRKTVEAMRGIAGKMEGLKFINPKILPLSRGIQAALAQHLPVAGPLSDDDKVVIQSLLLTMASAESLAMAAEVCTEGGDFWAKPKPQPVAVAAAPEVATTPVVAAETEAETVEQTDESGDQEVVLIPPPVEIKKRFNCSF